jgi:hypothetical protein
MNTFLNPKNPKKSQKIHYCDACDVTTVHKNDFKKHLLTAKHIRLHNEKISQQLPTKSQKIMSSFKCICGKVYKYSQGLSAHKKKCIILQKEVLDVVSTPVESTKLTVDSSFIMEMCKENKEIKNLLIEQMKENKDLMNKMVEITQNSLTVPTTINNNNNTTNNQFNLNLFLNENCKNAVNFSDFINNIQVTDDDLENNAKMGFVEGVTKIIMDNLRQLDLTNRPIHCTDVKRETIYVKEQEQWDKENSNKSIQRGIQDITCKSMQQLCQWREENPSYADDMDSELGEKSIMMQQNSMAGPKREDYYPKIIKNIAKETILNKKRMIE